MSLKDFKTLEDLVSNAIPNGEYVIEFTDVQSGLSKVKHTPHVTFKYTEHTTGQKDYLPFYLTEKAIKGLGAALRRCKVENLSIPSYTDDMEEYAKRWADALTPMVNKSFRAEFTTEIGDDGVERNRVKLLGTADGAPLNLGIANVI